MEPDAYNNLLEHSNCVVISEEAFLKILEGIPAEVMEEIYDKSVSKRDLCLNIMALISNLLTQEMYKNMLEEIPAPYTKTLDRMSPKIEEEILIRMTKDSFDKISGEISGIYNELRKIKYVSINDAFFEHCYERDITNNTTSTEEKTFMDIIKKNRAGFKWGKLWDDIIAENQFYIDYYEKYMGELENTKREKFRVAQDKPNQPGH